MEEDLYTFEIQQITIIIKIIVTVVLGGDKPRPVVSNGHSKRPKGVSVNLLQGYNTTTHTTTTTP